ncbi:hypothetical protein PINS_up005057 [Pythium insidiosum]|nr:hypothetical protein PINS_up005057 [Pythium insidiosum]
MLSAQRLLRLQHHVASPLATLSRRRMSPLLAVARRPCASTTPSTSSSKASAAAARRQEMVEKGKSHWEKLKELWRQYGIVAVGTYFSMYGIVLGSIYVAIEQGWVSTARTSRPEGSEQAAGSDTNANANANAAASSPFNLVTATNKIVTLAEDLGVAQYMDLQRVNSKTGSFVIAWVATKFTEPLRLAVTLAITPRIARLVGRAPKKILTPPKL